jgi:hypothetical protein
VSRIGLTSRCIVFALAFSLEQAVLAGRAYAFFSVLLAFENLDQSSAKILVNSLV